MVVPEELTSSGEDMTQWSDYCEAVNGGLGRPSLAMTLHHGGGEGERATALMLNEA